LGFPRLLTDSTLPVWRQAGRMSLKGQMPKMHQITLETQRAQAVTTDNSFSTKHYAAKFYTLGTWLWQSDWPPQTVRNGPDGEERHRGEASQTTQTNKGNLKFNVDTRRILG
jgi:hypothetical protein